MGGSTPPLFTIMTSAQEIGRSGKRVYVTQKGLPLTLKLEWPYHRSVTGADFYILHADIVLENSGEAGVPLHALVALQLTLTVKEVLPSLEPKDTLAPTVNTLRKAVDTKELEFLKMPKRVPVQFSSRRYSYKQNRWAFGQAADEEIALFLERQVYWQTKLGESKVWVADPTDAQYLDTEPRHIAEIAQQVAGKGQIRLEGEWATATPQLMARGAEIEAAMRRAQEELEKKHAFERG